MTNYFEYVQKTLWPLVLLKNLSFFTWEKYKKIWQPKCKKWQFQGNYLSLHWKFERISINLSEFWNRYKWCWCYLFENLPLHTFGRTIIQKGFFHFQSSCFSFSAASSSWLTTFQPALERWWQKVQRKTYFY